MKKLEQFEIDQIIELYRKGATPLELAKQFGIRNNSITRLLRNKGITRTQLPRVSDQDIQIIIKDYISGTSSEIIADKLGINGRTVCRILKRNNVKVRPTSRNKRAPDGTTNLLNAIEKKDGGE
jgi:DNA invertase Pin-like site-specific DNA recombinase